VGTRTADGSAAHDGQGEDQLFRTPVSAPTGPGSKGGEGTQASFDAAFGRFIPDAIKQQARGYTVVGEVPFDPDVPSAGTADPTGRYRARPGHDRSHRNPAQHGQSPGRQIVDGGMVMYGA
jgi:hypothetical protein